MNGRLQVKVEGATARDLFRSLSDAYEAFGTESACGACGSQNIRPQCRKSGTYEFFELHCDDCSAELHMGQKTEGGKLYPKRREEDGTEIGVRGWKKFTPAQTQPGARPQPRPARRS
jgi:hypothetical protein